MESHKKIEHLLEAYFEGKTSLAEEKRLREYFNGPDVAPQFSEFTPMFQYMVKARTEHSQREVYLPPSGRLRLAWASIAAVLVLAFGIYFGQSYQEQKQAELAYQQTREALSLLAENLDRGNKKIIYLNEFDETTQKMYRNN